MEQIALLDEILTKVKQEERKSYVSFSVLLTKLKSPGRKLFGLTEKKPSGPTIEKALQPYLGGSFVILKNGAKLFLAFKLPIDEIALEALQIKFQKGPFSPSTLAQFMPMKKDDFVASFNRLLEAGRISVSVNDKFIVTVRNVNTQATFPPSPAPRPSAPPSVSPPSPPQDDRKLFRDAFEQLDQGRIFVRICNLRRKLGWSEERFNSLLRKLRSEGAVQLHAGDVSSMTEDDIAQSFTDENNFFYATLTMKSEQY